MKDIMKIQIGNIEPKKSIKIMITYCQELEVSMNKFYLLSIPSTITTRYNNSNKSKNKSN